jgi:hypothetical protein
MYDSYVDLHVSVILPCLVVMVLYPSILGRGGGRAGGRDGSGGGRLGIQRRLGGRGFGRGLNGQYETSAHMYPICPAQV